MEKNKKIKVLQTSAVLPLFLSLLILYFSSPVKGYELSLYHSLSSLFWITASLTILSSLLLISLSYISNKKSWVLGMGIIFSIYFLLLVILPIYRGYYFDHRGWRDILVHIGRSKTIIESGHLSSDNMYPLVHILMAVLRLFGFSFEVAAKLLAYFISIFYILLIIVLSKAISKKKRESLFVFLFAIPLVFSYLHREIHPATYSLFLLPIVFFIYHKYQTHNLSQWYILGGIMIFSIVFFHPMTTVVSIGIFLLLSYWEGFKNNTRNKSIINYLISLQVIAFLAWITYFSRGIKSIRNIFLGLIYDVETSPAEAYGGILARADIGILEILEVILFRFGPVLIYLFIGTLLSIYIIKKIIKKRALKLDLETMYCFLFCFGLLIAIIFFISYFIESNPIRISRFAIFFGTIFIGLSVHKNFYKNKKNDRQIATLLIILIVFSVSILGIFNLYSGPHTSNPNQQMTHMEYEGLGWYFENRDLDKPLLSSGMDVRKNEIYYFGLNKSRYNRGDLIEGTIPSHFNYGENDHLKTTIQELNYSHCYMITNEYNRKSHLAFPEGARDEASQYLEEDFQKLESDETVHKIYENGEFEVWVVG